MHETLKLDLSGVYNFTTKEYVVRPTITYDITDAVTVCVGAQKIDGPDESIYGWKQLAQQCIRRIEIVILKKQLKISTRKTTDTR